MGSQFSSANQNRTTSSHTRSSNLPTNNLPPIVFHGVHGENIRLSRSGAVARRAESFCKGITFSDRPVCINERVYLKFVETSSSWSGALRFGFTNNDPINFRSSLPKYACPDLTNKPGNWAKALGERYAQPETVVFYYVTDNGDVYFGIDGEENGLFFSGVNTSGPLWALIDIYGNTVGVEFVDPRHQLNNNRHHVAAPIPIEDESYIPSVAALNLENEDTELHSHQTSFYTPMPFHKTTGINIVLSSDRCIAVRNGTEFCCGYVFTSRPLQIREKLIVKILETDRSERTRYEGSLAFGVTSCNPASINGRELPEDADNLLDRREYWVFQKNVAGSPQNGDELSFTITETGAIYFAKNNQPPQAIMYVDQTQQLWAFFDIYGHTLKIQSLGTAESSDIPRIPYRNGNTLNINGERHLNMGSSSPSVSGLHVCLPPNTVHSPHGKEESWVGRECVVCYDQHVDSVLYSCGHLCMCYNCAVQQWKGEGGGQCPICRAVIRDVIRIFRS